MPTFSLSPSPSDDSMDQLVDIDTLSVCSSLSPSPPPPPSPPSPAMTLAMGHFYESHLVRRAPSFKDLCQLEFYQVFPHDSASTLCLQHFLQLAEPWFRRRGGYPETATRRLARRFPHGRLGVRHAQDAGARDAQAMALVAQREPWRLRPVEELMEDLKEEVLAAEQHLRYDRRACVRRHARAPDCGVGDPLRLVCAFCTAVRWPKARDVYGKMELLRRRGGGHGAFREEDEAHLEGGPAEAAAKEAARRRAGARPPMLDATHAYRSVGGLHFLVDACDGRVMIKFASTRASSTEQQARWVVGEGRFLDKHMFDRPGAFDLTVCSAGDSRCVCQAGRYA
ncbi:hypothetical protein ESCO_004657 [Escovopsis weberi]|uniref:Uncharacterized protein n=1 Tax=Escovopsis weberi TaxID=150374 RepID=A0A0M9VRL8_ESCWE|nr:hypothetical protein ESCO_004657 [Escovopsis weberi]